MREPTAAERTAEWTTQFLARQRAERNGSPPALDGSTPPIPMPERALVLGPGVFPVHPRRKAPPLIQNFSALATHSLDQMQRWRRQFGADVNWALAMSEEYVTMDVDMKGGDGWEELKALEAEYGPLPLTYQQTSPANGGGHLVFRTSTPIRNSVGKLAPHLDGRGVGGYILLSGSVISEDEDGAPLPADRAGRYSDNGHLEVAELPDAWRLLLVARCKAPKAKHATSPAVPLNINQDRARTRFIEFVKTADPAIQGQGGDTLTVNIAMKGKDFGVSDSVNLDVMLEHYNPRCQPPWGLDELRVKVRNAYHYGNEAPGSAAPEVDFATPAEGTTTAAGATMLDPKAPWLESMNKDNCVVNLGRDVLVFRPHYDPVSRRRVFHRHSFSALEQLYQNDLVNVVQASGKVVLQNKATAWLNHPKRRQALGGAAYAPDQSLPDTMLNLDAGFGIEPKAGSWPLMQRHIRDLICSRDEESYRYVRGWLAHAVQRRADRALVALVLRGDRGVGKGILGNTLLKISGQHGIYISNAEQLTGKFNGHLEDCSFLFGDEAFFPGDKRHLSTLKALITESTIPIEAKFERVRMVKNCLHILLASNETFVIPAGRDERRFAVFDVNDRYKQDSRYFDPLRQELGLDPDTDGQARGASAMLYDLLRDDLSAFDITTIPQTEALLDQKLHAMSATAKWLIDCLEHGRFEESFDEGDQWETAAVTLMKERVYRTYRGYSKLAKEYRSEEVGPWMKELKKMLPGCVQDSRPRSADNTRPRMLTFQPLAECRSAFSTWIGHSLEWRTDGEQDDDRAKELSKEVFG